MSILIICFTNKKNVKIFVEKSSLSEAVPEQQRGNKLIL